MMDKGDKTPHGIFLGERLVDRDPRLTIEQLADLPQIYSDQAPQKDVVDASGESTGVTEPDLTIFMDKAIVFVFSEEHEPVEVPEQTINGHTIPGYTFTPEPTEIEILAEDL